jgi:hypothetical protein
MRTAQSVIASFTDRTMKGEVIAPEEWLMAAQMLTVLITEETNKLYELQSLVAKMKVDFMDVHHAAVEKPVKPMSSAEAKTRVEATVEYRDMKKQEAFIEQIWEIIRVAKKQAEIASK